MKKKTYTRCAQLNAFREHGAPIEPTIDEAGEAPYVGRVEDEGVDVEIDDAAKPDLTIAG